MTDSALFIGLMSGTSMDGVDGVLARISDGGMALLGHAFRPFPADLRDTLLALNVPGEDELRRGAEAALDYVALCANAVADVLQAAGVTPSEVSAIGSHGQTVRHRPDRGYTLQLNAPAALAEQTGIRVVADFRSRDVAAGGQGAPLVPAFHRAVFARPGRDVAVLNLGGFANLSLLYGDGRVLGFDTGPANVLLDHWVHRHRGADFDAGGEFAASGLVRPRWLDRLLTEAYFRMPPPKSTGRDLFGAAWLEAYLRDLDAPEDPADVQATLAELTARTVTDALRAHMPAAAEVVVCGGGAGNVHLMGRLQALLPGAQWMPSDARGVPAQQVEAVAFAWLARKAVAGAPGNLPEVTGARGPRVLGAIYPA